MATSRFRGWRTLSAFALLASGLVVSGGAGTATAATTDLFFSEYIEGSGFNKAIEIYNGTGGAVDLAAGVYTLELYTNGSPTVSQSAALTGTIADGDVFVLANSGADAVILAEADVTEINLVINWNGDDAVVLRKNGAVIDAIGQVGTDPGSQWGSGLTSTQDNTLRRKDSVCAGDTNETDAFDPATEWDGFANNTLDGFGTHTANCDGGTGGPTDPVINEFVVNHVGADTEAFVEVFGTPSTDYSAFTVLEIEGDTGGGRGTIDAVLPVGSTDASGFWTDDEDMENATVTILLVEGFTGTAGDDLDDDNDGSFDTTPWTRIVDDVATTDASGSDLTYSTSVLAPFFDGNAFGAGGASRIPNGTDTDVSADWVRNDFDGFGFPGFVGSQALGEAVNTPGAVNEVITVLVDPVGVCGDPATLIHDIQGSGLASGDVGNIREIEGVVVGDFQDDVGEDGDLNGFHLQEEDSDVDGDPLTSEGIFVFQGSNPAVDVAKGDVVRVRGSVTEFFEMTQINNVESVLKCGTGTATAATVGLPVTSVDDFEAFEGMYVTFPQDLVISEYFNFDRFNEIVLTTDRYLTPTAEFEPGSPEQAQAAADYLLNRITLDDGRTSSNPDPAIHPNGGVFDLTNLFRGGDTVANVTGVLDYGFGLYRIQPTQGADYTSVNTRPAAPDDVSGSLTVASFNVLNYFNTLDYPSGDPLDNKCGPFQDQGCRGADNADERTRQLDKIVSAMTEIDADVLGIIEVENTAGVEAMTDIVDGLNTVAGTTKYAYVDTGLVGDDVIKVGFIYQPGTVTPIGDHAVLDDPAFVAPFGVDRNRAALAQTFEDNSTGGIFTAVVNHLKSKGSSGTDDTGEVCDDPNPTDPDCDQGDGQGYFNRTRAIAAQLLADWLATDPTGSGDADVLIIGDLNSYDKEEPIDILVAAGYDDLLFQYGGESAYSYLFDGRIGYLDYAMSNASLTPQVTGATVWHINADEPDLIDYDTSFKGPNQDLIYAPDQYRSSDHDPVIVGLDVCDEIAPTFDELSVTPNVLWPANHKYVDVETTVVVSDNFDIDPTVTLVSVMSNEPDDARGNGDGNTVDDIVIVDDTHFELRSERAGNGSGRTYTITYEVADDCGNTTVASVTVSVPKNQLSKSLRIR